MHIFVVIAAVHMLQELCQGLYILTLIYALGRFGGQNTLFLALITLNNWWKNQYLLNYSHTLLSLIIRLELYTRMGQELSDVLSGNKDVCRWRSSEGFHLSTYLELPCQRDNVRRERHEKKGMHHSVGDGRDFAW